MFPRMFGIVVSNKVSLILLYSDGPQVFKHFISISPYDRSNESNSGSNYVLSPLVKKHFAPFGCFVWKIPVFIQVFLTKPDYSSGRYPYSYNH